MSEYKPNAEIIKELEHGVHATLSHNRYRERITFNGVPSQSFRDYLKKNDWWYDYYNHYWDRQFSHQSWNALLDYCKNYRTIAILDNSSSDDFDEELPFGGGPISSTNASSYDDYDEKLPFSNSFDSGDMSSYDDDEELPFGGSFSVDESLSQSAKNENELEEPERIEITFNDIVVRNNGFYCWSNHAVKDVIGKFSIIDRIGNISYEDIPLAYCETCKVYYILDGTYKDIKKYGVFGCQIMTKTQFQSSLKKPGDFGYGWRESSDLKNYGYTVAENSGLTTAQRRTILRSIIDQDVLSKDSVLSYLDFFQTKLKGSERARKLWQEDREFVAHYKIEGVSEVRIRRF